MKLKELKSDGIFVGINLSKESNKEFSLFFSKLNIPNFNPDVDRHVTIIYSRKFANIKLSKNSYEVNRFSYDVFDTDSGKKCLVLKLVCPELSKRFSELMSTYELTYDYPFYKPHITISYDIEAFDISKLPNFNQDLYLENEYKNDLNLDWNE